MRATVAAVLCVAVLGGCGSSGTGLKGPDIGKAKTFSIAGFSPAGPIEPGRPTTLRFHVEQPSGGALTKFKTGSGPHTGVHLIIVRGDLSTIIHRHPPIGPDGTITQSVTFPSAGPWRVLVDVYPDLGANTLQNFQLTRDVKVSGAYAARPLPRFRATQTVAGYRFTMRAPKTVKALKPELLEVNVTDPSGKPATFTPWYGALAHAIFFKRGSLDYFHTHVCGAGAKGCTSAIGGSRVTGKSTTPGKLSVGVLLPTPGTWRVFVQIQSEGRHISAPFTLVAR